MRKLILVLGAIFLMIHTDSYGQSGAKAKEKVLIEGVVRPVGYIVNGVDCTAHISSMEFTMRDRKVECRIGFQGSDMFEYWTFSIVGIRNYGNTTTAKVRSLVLTGTDDIDYIDDKASGSYISDKISGVESLDIHLDIHKTRNHYIIKWEKPETPCVGMEVDTLKPH